LEILEKDQNKPAKFHPIVLIALLCFFILQVVAGYFPFSFTDRLLTSGLITAVALAITVFELWRLDKEKKRLNGTC
jgi:type VI protein secretion system component VasK